MMLPQTGKNALSFCIIGTPRSRTAWLARFLSHGGMCCAHEPSRFWSRAADMTEFFRHHNAADSMLTFKWRELTDAGVRLIVVTRPYDDVIASLRGAGIWTPPSVQRSMGRLREAIDELPPGLPRFEFAKLDLTCGDIFKLALGYPCPPVWRGLWRHRRVTAAFDATLRDVAVNQDGLHRFYGDAICPH